MHQRITVEKYLKIAEICQIRNPDYNTGLNNVIIIFFHGLFHQKRTSMRYYASETTIDPLLFSSPFDYICIILLFTLFMKSTVKVFRANLKLTRLINDMWLIFTKEVDGVILICLLSRLRDIKKKIMSDCPNTSYNDKIYYDYTLLQRISKNLVP